MVLYAVFSVVLLCFAISGAVCVFVRGAREARARDVEALRMKQQEALKAVVPCPYCGRSITGKPNFCPHCGQDLTVHYRLDAMEREQHETQLAKDTGSFGYFILGLLFPAIAIIVYFIIKADRPESAREILSGLLFLLVFSLIVGSLFAYAVRLTG